MSDPRLTPETITLYGTGWRSDCKRSKQFFGEQRVPYHYVDIDNDPNATTFVEEVNKRNGNMMASSCSWDSRPTAIW